ncbi:hypothetical protein CSB37_02760 [bacterium DOLZORAL124_38_8]|nr:MAG: hypothetical protein CSB37_02760 [bacterium DOLZORAL124_38_8]
MKKIDALYQELLKEFPELKSEETAVKKAIRDLLKNKPQTNISTEFKESLRQKIINSNKINVVTNVSVDNKTNWNQLFSYFGVAFAALVAGFYLRPLFLPTPKLETPAPVQLFSNHITNLRGAPHKQTKNQPALSDTTTYQANPINQPPAAFTSLAADETALIKEKGNDTMDIKFAVYGDGVTEEAADVVVKNCNKNFLLFWTPKTVKKTKSVLNITLKELFSYHKQSKLVQNSTNKYHVKLDKAVIKNGVAQIYVTADKDISLCEKESIKNQIEVTAQQFESVQKTEIHINKERVE